MAFAHLRKLQRLHNAWLEILYTDAKPALDAALAEVFAACPELTSISWTLSRPERAGYACVVSVVEFHAADGSVWGAADGVTEGPTQPTAASLRRYRELVELFVANGEVVGAVVLRWPVRVVAERDGAMTIEGTAG